MAGRVGAHPQGLSASPRPALVTLTGRSPGVGSSPGLAGARMRSGHPRLGARLRPALSTYLLQVAE